MAKDHKGHPVQPVIEGLPRSPDDVPKRADGPQDEPGPQLGLEPEIETAHEWANKRFADVLGEKAAANSVVATRESVAGEEDPGAAIDAPDPQSRRCPPTGAAAQRPGPYSGEMENEDKDPVGRPPRL